jgi:drug/metabolite transporter (DMT)-like permease
MPNNTLLGALWMLGAVASFACMQIAGRELSGGHDAFSVLLFRSLVGLALITPIAIAFGGIKNVTTRRPIGHCVRNCIHFIGQFGWFYGIAFLPMADVTALTSSTPLFGVALAIIFMGELLSLRRLAIILVGFLGVLIVVRPGVVPLELATGVTVLGAFCYAVSIIMVKALTRTEPPLRIVFFMMLLQLIFALACTKLQIVLPSEEEWPFVILVGIGGLTAHYSMARSVQLADASVVMPVNFLQLPLMALAGFAIYGEHIDPYTLGGGALILAATYLNITSAKNR